MPGSSPITTRGPAGAASSRSRTLSANTLIATSCAASRRRANRSRSVDRLSFTRQVQATHLSRKSSAARPWCATRCAGRCAFGRARGAPGAGAGAVRPSGKFQLQVQDLQGPSAEHRQRAVGRHLADRLRVVEIVPELADLGLVFVLARAQPAHEPAFGPQPLAQLLHQLRLVGPALAEQIPHAVEHQQRRGEVRRLSPSGERPRPAARHRPAAASSGTSVGLASNWSASGSSPASRAISPLVRRLSLKGRYRSSSSCLVVAAPNLARIASLSLPCSSIARRMRQAAVVEFTQVDQPGLQRAQGDVVQAAGGFLAVAGDEGNGGAAVEQVDGSLHLLLAHGEFLRQCAQWWWAWMGASGSRSSAAGADHHRQA
jgi:hypothetical protein